MAVHAGLKDDTVFQYLKGRRSVRVQDIAEPAPPPHELDEILAAGMRVPDHGKQFPFYMIVFEGDARRAAGEAIADISGDPEDKTLLERAPVVVAVIHRARRGKHPMWEQLMTAGALCHNISLAVHAKGYVSTWLSEWVAYDDAVKSRLGLDARDHIAGFLYIGSAATQPEERDRPDFDTVVTRWGGEGTALNKGDHYDREKFPYPESGFKPFK